MKKKRVKINLLSNDDYCTTTIISIINKLMRAGNVFFFAEDGIVELEQIINEAQWKCYKLFENDSGKMFIVDSAILLIENIREIDLKMIFENWTYWNGSERWLFVFDDKMADCVREIVNNSARLKKRKIREIEKKALLYIGVNELGAEMEQYNSYVMEIEYEETRNIVNELTDLVAGSCEIHIDIGQTTLIQEKSALKAFKSGFITFIAGKLSIGDRIRKALADQHVALREFAAHNHGD